MNRKDRRAWLRAVARNPDLAPEEKALAPYLLELAGEGGNITDPGFLEDVVRPALGIKGGFTMRLRAPAGDDAT